MSFESEENTIWKNPHECHETHVEGFGPVLFQSWQKISRKGECPLQLAGTCKEKCGTWGEMAPHTLKLETGVGQNQDEEEG